MVSSATSEALFSGQSVGVDVTQIERELALLWKNAARAEEGKEEKPNDGQQAVMRACVANLLIYVGSEKGTGSFDPEGVAGAPGESASLSDIITEIVARHPCRVLQISTHTRTGEPPIKAWISARCQLPQNGKRLCCEQINLSVLESAMAEVGGLVLPLLAPDIPVYFWWLTSDQPQGRYDRALDFSLPFYEELAESVDHVLFDSSCLSHPETTLVRLLYEMDRRGDALAFRDLNWARLTPWRQLTAQFFDSSEMQHFLSGLESVVIEGEPDHRPVSQQSLLFAAWIATRLGWKLAATQKSDTEWTIRLRGQQEAMIRIAGHGGSGGEVTAVQLNSTRGEQHAVFSVRRAEDAISAITSEQIGEAASRQRRVRMRYRTESRLMGDELEVAGRDVVYEESLAMVVRMLQ
ncbi:MAG: glucose-6-phosphate dehydrogenase assembly protein OpcA [Armatimonadetes bacterium]|nr:glucose-6-phosphate dehydrogenase assembly protein OpcA [Armatimonadota bacterium]